MKSRVLIILAAAMLMLGATAYAHHSFAGSYIEDKSVTIEGKVVQFDIRNPHSFINIEIVSKDGKAARWGGEWGGVTQLSEGGVTRFTLKVGDRIIIDGAPSRDPDEHKVLIRKVVRPATANSPEFTWGGVVR
jgi:Family of unknown function (DUF6152)